jgi:hypothetical protein
VRALQRVLDRVDYLGMRAWWQVTQEKMLVKLGYSKASPMEQYAILASSSGQTVKPDQSLVATLKESVFPYLAVAVVIQLEAEWPTATRWLAGAATVAYGLPAIGALLLSVAAVPFGIVSALGLLPCGWTLPLAGPYLRISVEPAPPGTWTVTQVTTESGNGRLSHSRAHDDPAVHSFVAQWLMERAQDVGRHTWPMPPPPSGSRLR